MFRFICVVLLCLISVPAHALVGVADPNSVIADYDPATGAITVSYNGVNNWYVESVTASLTGNSPLSLPLMPGLVSDNDFRVGESGFALATYTGADLGPIAATGLDISDLTVYWNAGLGSTLESAPVTLFGGPVVPEPSTGLLALLSILGISMIRRVL